MSTLVVVSSLLLVIAGADGAWSMRFYGLCDFGVRRRTSVPPSTHPTGYDMSRTHYMPSHRTYNLRADQRQVKFKAVQAALWEKHEARLVLG